ATVVERLVALEEVMSASGADQMWNTLSRVMKDAAKESLGVPNETARTYSMRRESWWFCEEVQTKVTLKQSRFKELLSCRDGNQEDIDLVKERAVGSSSPYMHYKCYYSRINQREVKTALKKMRRNKAVGPYQVPIEAWRSLEDERVKWLTCLFNKILSSAKMPDE
nr:retrovirus-related Pol polyprotein LINE-1 [Tanacetum cinerariifolium]